MSRRLTPQSSLENLRREAKRWLKAIAANDPDARTRFARAYGDAEPPAQPTLRDVQHALAREHGVAGWTALTTEIARLRAERPPASRDEAIQALLKAAENGDVAAIEGVLDAHPDIVSVAAPLEGHSGRRTALHFAASQEPAVRALLARGADPNVRDEGDDAMPLHFAAERGDMAIVRLLLEHGADPVGDGTGHELNVLGWATCFDYAYHAEVAAYLLAHGARHTIHTAVAMGAVDAIREIAARAPSEIDRAMDETNRRRRPLHLAIVKRRPESLAALLSLGADVEAEDAGGLTPLDQAALQGERAMSEQLIDAGAKVRLPAAVALDRGGDLRRLLRDEPHALRPGGRWDRLIIRAAEKGSGEIIETLIKAGASVHTQDRHHTAVDNVHGYTALHAAATNDNVAAARVLLAHGANPADREDKYWSTPAGWADYFGRTEIRDVILEGTIDIFDAIQFRPDRIDEILARDPQALDRRFGENVSGDPATKPWLDANWTPVAYAIAHEKGDVARSLAEGGADLTVRDSKGRTPATLAREAGQVALAEFLESRQPTRRPASTTRLVADFLSWSCPDWRQSGASRDYRLNDALRLLKHDPEIARENIFTAVVAGDIGRARELLDASPALANEIGGPRSWPPLLYLCAARLPMPASVENAVDIARLLIDRGADPNVFYFGGNTDIHYTALTAVLGRGEDKAPMHARARELSALLLEAGADPHDNQVLYNVFADNTSRPLLSEDIIWLLELMYEHSVRRGYKHLWDNPEWPMFDMGGAPSLGDEARRQPGAYLMLSAAVDRNLPRLATWMLEHGAGPNTSQGSLWQRPRRTLYQMAIERGHHEMAALLVRHGATPTPLPLDDHGAFVAACFALDKDRARAYVAKHPGVLNDYRAMFKAVERDRADVVELLLDLGVSPDVEAFPGRTRPLHIAAGGAPRCAELLIARGADVDARDANYDSPPLGWASWGRNHEMIELLGRYSRDVWYLTHTGHVERLTQVLHEEPELARVTRDGETPLMWLPDSADDALAIAKLFVELGADVTVRNAHGYTAADIAERRGLGAVVEVLRSVLGPPS